jgi:hypothetical protein
MISINSQTFIIDLLNTVDLAIGNFVHSGYQNLVANNQTVITLLMTFYIAWLGYKFMMHTLSLEISVFARHLVLLIILYALLIDWNLFYTFFYNIFTNEPAVITETMINSIGNVNIGGENTATALRAVGIKNEKLINILMENANKICLLTLKPDESKKVVTINSGLV